MPKQKVYISSTFRDLKEYRATLIGLFQNQLKNNFELSNIMERMFDDGSYTPFLEDCVKAVEESDIYILIFGNKVGSAPPDSTCTYTEIEFDTALTKQKKIFFLKYPVFDKSEIDDKSKHDEVLKKFDGRPSHTFKDNIEFQNAFLLNLYQFLPVQPQNKFNEPAILLSSNGPAEPSVFLGREDELLSIREKLSERCQLMLINAEGGIGKTTLASKYWYESLYDYKYNAWLFCENGIINALKELAPKLNVDLSGKGENQQLTAIKLAISKVHDDFLIILDNANDVTEIQKFKQTFEGFHWHVLLTSRCSGILDNNQQLQIMHLPPALAKELFKQNYNENTADFDVLIDKILLAIDYHTLLIDVFSKNLRKASKNGLDSNAFFNKLENEGLYLGEDSFNIQTPYIGTVKKNAANTDQILDILYDFTKLEENERHALVNISLLPAESYTDIFLRDLMVDSDRNIRKDYLKTLESLYQNGWLSGTQNDCYRISPVIQKLVINKSQNTLIIDAQDLLNKLDYLLVTDAHIYLNQTLNEIEPFSKLIDHLSNCFIKTPIFQIANINLKASIYYKNIGNYYSANICCQNSKNIIEKLLIIDPNNLYLKSVLAISISSLGEIYEFKGEIENAHKNYLEHFRISHEIYILSPENLSYKLALAQSYYKLASIYEQKGDIISAAKNYSESANITIEIYELDTGNLHIKDKLAVSVAKIGGLLEQTGDLNNAFENYLKYFNLRNEIYNSDPDNLYFKNGLSNSYEKLGHIYEQKGEIENALKNYIECNKKRLEINKISPENLSYNFSLAISYDKLGGIYSKKGNVEQALQSYLESVVIFRKIYEISPQNLLYKNGYSVILERLGSIYSQKDDFKNALDNYLEYFRISQEIYNSSPKNISYKNNLAISYEKLGDVYEKKGEFETAIENYVERNKIAQEIYANNPSNLSYKKGLAVSYRKLGYIYNKKRDYKNTLVNYLKGLRITKEIFDISPENLSFKADLANCYYNLGVFNNSKNIIEANEYLNLSFKLYEELTNKAPEVVHYWVNIGIVKTKLDELASK